MRFLRPTKLLLILLSGCASEAKGVAWVGANALWTGAAVGVSTITAGCLVFLEKVRTGDQCLIERCGVFNRKLGPGPYFLTPCIFFLVLAPIASACRKLICSIHVALVSILNRRLGWHLIARPFEGVSMRATLREQVLDVPPQQCYTLDNAPVSADAVIYIRIHDVEAARYQVQDLRLAIMNICLTQLREEIGKLSLDESFSSRERINSALLRDLNEATQPWGVQVTRVEIQNLDPSRDILHSMELQMSAERHKRAAILTSEGERTKLTNEAEGRAKAALADAEAQRQTVILRAQAEAERLRVEAEGFKNSINTISETLRQKGSDNAVDNAVQIVMMNKYLEAQAKFADSEGTKVLFFPTKDTVPITYEGIKSIMS